MCERIIRNTRIVIRSLKLLASSDILSGQVNGYLGSLCLRFGMLMCCFWRALEWKALLCFVYNLVLNWKPWQILSPASWAYMSILNSLVHQTHCCFVSVTTTTTQQWACVGQAGMFVRCSLSCFVFMITFVLWFVSYQVKPVQKSVSTPPPPPKNAPASLQNMYKLCTDTSKVTIQPTKTAKNKQVCVWPELINNINVIKSMVCSRAGAC